MMADFVFFAAIAVIAAVGIVPMLWVVYSAARDAAEQRALLERDHEVRQ